MSDKEVLLTPDGLKKLEEELENLKSVKRREVAERIKIAIGYGDISENSEYEDAKNEQARRIKTVRMGTFYLPRIRASETFSTEAPTSLPLQSMQWNRQSHVIPSDFYPSH